MYSTTKIILAALLDRELERDDLDEVNRSNMEGARNDLMAAADETDSKKSYEWQVIVAHSRGKDNNPMIIKQSARDLKFAEEWTALERKDYPPPIAEVWIERREVGPWERVAS